MYMTILVNLRRSSHILRPILNPTSRVVDRDFQGRKYIRARLQREMEPPGLPSNKKYSIGSPSSDCGDLGSSPGMSSDSLSQDTFSQSSCMSYAKGCDSESSIVRQQAG
jgi:hypothetical protein